MATDRSTAKRPIGRVKVSVFTLDEHLAYWEQCYPGKGEAIMDMLRLFYGWKPALKPTAVYLHLYATEAIFWREINGIRTYFPYELASLQDPVLEYLGSSLADTLCNSFMESDDDDLWEPLEHALEKNLLQDLKQLFETSLKEPHDPRLREIAWDALRSTIFYSVYSIVMNKPDQSESFKSLFSLWFTGNHPIGFDAEDRLLILVAG